MLIHFHESELRACKEEKAQLFYRIISKTRLFFVCLFVWFFFIMSEVIPDLAKEIVLLVGELFSQPGFLHPRQFSDTKKARGREMFLLS